MSIGKKTLVVTALVLGVAPAAMAAKMPPPSASGFAALLMSSTTSFAKAHGESRRIERPHCVEPVRGHYMCSYEVRTPGDAAGCHLMQALWTPAHGSLFTVTLAGRARNCRSVKDALRSLR